MIPATRDKILYSTGRNQIPENYAVFNPRDFSSDFRHHRDRDYRRHNIEETLFTHDRFVSVLMISEVHACLYII